VGGEIFRTSPDRLWGPPSLLYNGYRVFPGGKVAGALTIHPHLAPRLRKSIAIHLLPLWAFMACYRVNFAFDLYLYLDLLLGDIVFFACKATPTFL